MKVSLIYRYLFEKPAMMFGCKYFMHGILKLEEKESNLWKILIQEQSKNKELQAKTQAELLKEQPGYDPELIHDFLEVWLSIEKSILNFENEKESKNEESSYKYKSKTNLNFEL